MQKWCVNGLFRMALFALRDIDANEELTYDYNFALFNPADGQVTITLVMNVSFFFFYNFLFITRLLVNIVILAIK